MWSRALFCAAIAVSTPLAWAQDAWPTRAIKMVVPYPPGALTDTLARAVTERLSRALGQPIVVENRAGAGTLLGAEQVKHAPADGYTLMMVTSTTLGISPALYKKPAIDPVKDFAPVAQVGAVDFFLIAAPSFPAKSVKEMLDLIKSGPGKYNYASVGSGSPHHLFMEVLKKDFGLDIRHVPYKGTVAAIPDVINGNVQVMFADATVAVPQIKAGRVNGLGTSSARQTALVPQVPPIARTVPGFDWQAWQGVAVAAATPRAIVQRLNAEMQKFQNTAEFRALLGKFGMEPSPPNTPEQFSDVVKKDAVRWAEAVRVSGARVD
ncbi:MAG: tripartite tricarboxylate transporter substrate binding protein [Betaproteobacteria bacterium]|nr:MAG: tripartite tricarboxylate transporter substrate binding protein [Betaproteobacteria bacterium]